METGCSDLHGVIHDFTVQYHPNPLHPPPTAPPFDEYPESASAGQASSARRSCAPWSRWCRRRLWRSGDSHDTLPISGDSCYGSSFCMNQVCDFGETSRPGDGKRTTNKQEAPLPEGNECPVTSRECKRGRCKRGPDVLRSDSNPVVISRPKCVFATALHPKGKDPL